MPEINPVTKDQLFEKKIAENTGSDYNVGDISSVVPVTKDQALLKEIALNSAGQSGDITELEEKLSATQDMITDAYDSTHTYNGGDYCIYENVLYKCNTASTTGDWDLSKWDSVTVAHEVGELTEKVVKSTYKLIGEYDFIQNCGLTGKWNLYVNELTQSCKVVIYNAKVALASTQARQFGIVDSKYRPPIVITTPITMIYNDVNNSATGYVSISNTNGWLVWHTNGTIDIDTSVFVNLDWFY